MTEQNPYQSPKSLQVNPDSMPRHRSFRLTLDQDSSNPGFTVGKLREAMRFAAIQQTVWMILMCCVLDGGTLFRTSIVAALVFWALAFALSIRREELNDQEVLCVKWGYLPIFLITANIGIIADIARKVGLFL